MMEKLIKKQINSQVLGIRDHFVKIKFKDLDIIDGKMVENIKESGKKINYMVEVNLHGRMEDYMMGNL